MLSHRLDTVRFQFPLCIALVSAAVLHVSIVFGQNQLVGRSEPSTLGQFHSVSDEVLAPQPVYRSTFLPPSNDDCNSAATLTVNAGCTSGTTELATVQVGEATTPGCVTNAFSQTVWYRFVATSTTMFVQLNVTSYGGSGVTWGPANWAAAVYRSTGACPPSTGNILSCRNTNSVGTGDGVITNYLSGLTIGATYLVQVGYSTGQGANSIPNFCIRVGDQFINCNTCNSPCGPACGFTTAPTVNQVTTSCPPYPAFPLQEGTVADTQCYTFTAVNSTVSFNVILNSTCGTTGNVTNFTWNLYSGGCGSPIQTGTLSSLTFPNLVIGQTYTYCYSFSVPSSCYHSIYYPYFIGAAPVLLPVELIRFEGRASGSGVQLTWTTASETNNDYFVIEKSSDGSSYDPIGSVRGKGTTSTTNDYGFFDDAVEQGISYYRLLQVDRDGKTEVRAPIAVRFESNSIDVLIHPNPSKGNPTIAINSQLPGRTAYWTITDLLGQVVLSSDVFFPQNSSPLDLGANNLIPGTYFFRLISGEKIVVRRFQVTD